MSTAPFNDILYEEKNGVATITFNRPDRLNAFRMGMYEEVIEAIHRAGWNPDIGVIVLTGAGAARSASRSRSCRPRSATCPSR